MSTITKNYSINEFLSATTTFNGDTLNNITSTVSGNIINLKHNLTPTAFEGQFYTTLTSVLCGCEKDYVVWNLSTKYWSVSTSLGSGISNFPYFLKYTQGEVSPYTFPLEDDTSLSIRVCQDIKCETVFNTITFLTDQNTMSEIHDEITNIVDTVIKPRAINYLTSTNHPLTSIDDVIKVQPFNSDKRYLKTLASVGYTPLSGDGTSNVYLLFTDTPSAYITSCTNPIKTETYDTDIYNFVSFLSSVPVQSIYKATILATTYVNNVDSCPAFTSHLSSVQTGTGSNYTLQGSLIDYNNIKYKHQVLYRGSGIINPSATTTYYTNLILDSLYEQGIDLINYTPNIERTTLCESLTAIVRSAPCVKVYTPNRFVLVGREVKFENLTTNIDSLVSIKVDYGDDTSQTYTGSSMYTDFKKTYVTAGYKTLNITTTTTNGSVRAQTFANIIKVVNFYD